MIKMGLTNEVGAVIVVSFLLASISRYSFSLWSFLFAFVIACPISTFIASKFASGQKTMGSGGRYEKTWKVYLYFMVGIVVSGYLGSRVTDYLVETVNPNDFAQIFFFSLVASFLSYALVKAGLY